MTTECDARGVLPTFLFMLFYKTQPIFDRRTGKPAGFEAIRAGVICDYSGELIDRENPSEAPLYSIRFSYNNDAEPDWYYDDIDHLMKLDAIRLLEHKEFDIEYSIRAKLAEEDFHFRWSQEAEADTSFALIRDWWTGYEKEDNIFFECGTLGDAARRQRLVVVHRLLKEGRYTPQQLGLCRAWVDND